MKMQGRVPQDRPPNAITKMESHFAVTIPREEVAWMQGGINIQPAGHGPQRDA